MPWTSLLCLPFELISIITAFLPQKDTLTFSLVLPGACVHTLAPLFSDFVLVKRDGDIKEAYNNLKGVRQDIKHSIRPVWSVLNWTSPQLTKSFISRCITIKDRLYLSDFGAVNVFRLLETLPNLTDLHLDKYCAPVQLADVALIVQVAQHTSLHNLSFTVECDSVASGLPIIGPEGLHSLHIQWRVHDEPGSTGKSLAHLYEFFWPSLATLTHLDVTDFDLSRQPTNLQHLDFRDGNICPLLRNFQYNTLSHDIKVLAAISKKFPNLTHLGMVFNSWGYNDWAVWTVCIHVWMCHHGIWLLNFNKRTSAWTCYRYFTILHIWSCAWTSS